MEAARECLGVCVGANARAQGDDPLGKRRCCYVIRHAGSCFIFEGMTIYKNTPERTAI